MIAMVEGAKRQKTPNEIALSILLSALTIIFLLATATLLPYSIYAVDAAGQGHPVTVTVLVALLVCLIPTTIGGLLSAIGIAGMDRMIQANVHRHVGPRGRGRRRRGCAAAGQDRHHHAGQPAGHRVSSLPRASRNRQLADAAQLASLADETPEGRSIVVLAKERFRLARTRRDTSLAPHFVPFTAQDPHERRELATGAQIRKGAADAIDGVCRRSGRRISGRVHGQRR